MDLGAAALCCDCDGVVGGAAGEVAHADLKAGKYVFYVRAVGPGGTQAPAVNERFKVGCEAAPGRTTGPARLAERADAWSRRADRR